MWMRVCCALALLVFAGCDTTLEASDYEQSCTQSIDCVAVLVGDACECSCEYGAIATSDLSVYWADLEDAQDRCGDLADCGPCPSVAAYCNANNRCALVE